MKKTLMVLICLVSLMGIVLCGCNNHKHTFDTSEWVYNATSHWHKATCEHTDVKGDEGAHEFDGNICKVCKYDKTAAAEHKHDASTLLKVERKDATCTADGTKEHYKCKQCGKLFDSIGGEEITEADIVIPAKGHDKTLIYHRGVVPTCITEGVKENWECKSCGQRFDAETGGSDHEIDDVTLPVDPENHLQALKRVKEKAADCANEGNIAYYECTDCQAKYSDVDGKTEHKLEESAIVIPKNNVHDKLEHVAAKTATCMEDGNVEYYKCPRCNSCFTKEVGGEKIDDVVVKDPYNHVGEIEYVPAVYVTECGKKGSVEHYKCSSCNKLFSDPEGHRMIKSLSDLDMAAVPHDFSNSQGIPDGSKGHHYVCRRCGEAEKDLNGVEIIHAHNYPGGVCSECGYDCNHVCATGNRDDLVYYPAKNPTCKEDGNIEYYQCKKCNEYFADPYGKDKLDSVVIPKGRHIYRVENNEDEHWLICDICGIEAGRTEHMMKGGVCESSDNKDKYLELLDGCGLQRLYEDTEGGIIYGEGDDGYYVRGRSINNYSKDIVIPQQVNGKDVIGIHNNAFAGKGMDNVSVLNSLTLPSTIREIRAGAFNLAYIKFIWFEGNIDDWNKVTVEENNSGLNFCDNLYIKCDSEPSDTVYGLFYKDKETFYKHIDPQNTPTYGVIYEKIEGKDEYQVIGMNTLYFAGRPHPWIVKIQSTYNGLPVTKIKTMKIYDDQGNERWDTDYYSLLIPSSITDIGDIDNSSPVTTFSLRDVFYEGSSEQWKTLEDTLTNNNIYFNVSSKLAYYEVSDPQKTSSEGRFWHYDIYGTPVRWTPLPETNGVDLVGVDENGGDVRIDEWMSDDEKAAAEERIVSYKVNGIENYDKAFTKLKIPSTYKGKPVESIDGNAFRNISNDNSDIEYIVIPKSIKKFNKNGDYVTSFQDQPAKLFYEGNKDDWEKIENHELALERQLYDNTDHFVYFLLESQPTELGFYWHYDENQEPVVWDKTTGGEIIPEDTQQINNITYVISQNQKEYYVADYTGIVGADYVTIVDNIDGIPVTKILIKVFGSYKFEGNGKIIIIPKSIKEIEDYNPDNPNRIPKTYRRSNPIKIMYTGGNAEDFKEIKGANICGLDLTNIYILIGNDDHPTDDGQYWKYDENNEPVIYDKTEYVKDKWPEKGYDENGYKYSLDVETKTATIIDFHSKGAAVLKLPEKVTIDGEEYTVTEIGKRAFVNATDIVGIIFNTTIESVGVEAFYDINCIEWVIFNKYIKNIGEKAFYYRDVNAADQHYSVHTAFATRSTDYIPTVLASIYFDGQSEDWNQFVRGFKDWQGVNGSPGLVSLKHAEFVNSTWKFNENGYPQPILPTAKYQVVIGGVTYGYDTNTKTAKVIKGTYSQGTYYNIVIKDKIMINNTPFPVNEIPSNVFSKVTSVVVPDSVEIFGSGAFNGVSGVVIGNGNDNRVITADVFGQSTTIYYTGTVEEYEKSKLKEVLGNDRIVYYYSEEQKAGCWHFRDEFKTTPTTNYNITPSVPSDSQGWLDRSNFVRYTLTGSQATVRSYEGPANAAVVIPETIHVNGKDYTVTKIGDGAFCPNYMSTLHNKIKSIVLPKTVTSFGNSSFYSNNEYGYEATMEFFVMGAVTPSTYSIRFALALQGRIYFRGTTKDEVESMRKMSGYYEDALPYIYKETEPTMEDYTGANRYCRYWHFADKYETQPVAWHEKEIVVDGLKYTCNTVTKEATLWGGSVPFDNVQKKFILKVKDYLMVGGERYKVTEIAQSAFNGTTKAAVSGQILDEIELPDTIERIGKRAFYEQYKVKKMIIGNVKIIESGAFTGCFSQSEPVKIYFHGSKAQYESFLNVEGSFQREIMDTYNDILRDKVSVYYYSESVTSDGEYGIWKYDTDGKIVIVQDFPEKNE